MTVEFVLLIAMTTMLVVSVLFKVPQDSFNKAAPKLGARIEGHLMTGDGFAEEARDLKVRWKTE